PPFGHGSGAAKAALEKAYPRTKNDVFAALVERAIELLVDRGRVGAITSRTGFFVTSFQKWREDILLKTAPPVVFADLGVGVMDTALVEAAAYCLERGRVGNSGRSVFFCIPQQAGEKAAGLHLAISDPLCPGVATRYEINTSDLSTVPGSPFAYWISDSVRGAFVTVPEFGSETRHVRVGPTTGDDFRFNRAWWAVSERRMEHRWFLLAKGGKYSVFYDDVHLVINWAVSGREMIAFDRSTPRNIMFYFRPGLTWPRRTQSGLGFRVLPTKCIFGDKGPGAFIDGNKPDDLLALLGVVSSPVFRYMLDVQVAFFSYEAGAIQRTPVPDLIGPEAEVLASLARRGWSVTRQLDTTNETSHAFLLPQDLNHRITGLDRAAIATQLQEIQQQIDQAAFQLYGISAEEQATIEAATKRKPLAQDESDPEDEDDPRFRDAEAINTDREQTLSWLVGAAFGRFDPRLATGERPVPPEPEPFDPLPTRSPGMYPGDEGATELREILVNAQGHPDDIVERVRAIADRVHAERPGVAVLREWLAKDFFPLHVKMYSKSRRKAPIYWQFSSRTNAYSVWIYVHAIERFTIYRIQTDYLEPRIEAEEDKLRYMKDAIRGVGTAAQRKELLVQERFLWELRDFRAEFEFVRLVWECNLDDGVVICFAPLWRLVPHCKSWQKELKTTWEALCKGKYDWSHLAMRLWPERVVPKCVDDRSLAIAHGLEDVFWRDVGDGKRVKRGVSGDVVAEVIRKRTDPDVKRGLSMLLTAEDPSEIARKRREAEK
ncbi:MAG: BREX-1 system adenine-specific DNA-methyltransferase PglX, partial [Polyangiaceae bacterium]|nr:BREX-1 system adenine-specific DNA-methyltransferase PglX [Polyangiaceae bacterium]